MSDEVWNIDTKGDAINVLQEAYDALSDAMDYAEEMEDEVVEHHIGKAQEIVSDLVAFLELRR